MDAYCEHLGAHLGYGGTVVEERIRCPFHGWEWNDKGRNVRIPYEGIRYDELTSEQQGVLRDLIGVYLNRLRPGHAQIRLDEAFDHLRDTHFSWIGAHDDPAIDNYLDVFAGLAAELAA